MHDGSVVPNVYRNPQRPDVPLDETESLTVPRYGQLHMGFMFVFGVGSMLWLPVALVQRTSEQYLGAGTFAVTGAILVGVVLWLRRDHVVLEANYTRGELVVRPWNKPEQRVAFAHIQYVDMTPKSKSDEMVLQVVTTGGARIPLLETAATDTPMDWLEKVRANADRRAEEAKQAAST